MQRAWLLAILLLPLASVSADPWQFDSAIAVTPVTGPKIFHHLDSSGRHNVAVSADRIAVAWEDERDGTPRIYVAQKTIAATAFEVDTTISGEGEAFEPSIAGLGDGRFAIAWEEDGRIHARIVTSEAAGPVFVAEARDSVQASLATRGNEILLVMAKRTGRFPQIALTRLQVSEDNKLHATEHCVVDSEPAMDEQLYPSVSRVHDRIVVAWEDRRPGHTIIMAAANTPDNDCTFSPPQRINKRHKGGGVRGMPYGKGYGVSRVAITAFGETEAYLVWADKRDFREGYDIYGASWNPAGGFGSNERVQDEFGGVARQWHASIAGSTDGNLVAAWDDDRNGNPGIMLSWHTDDGWSDDTALAVGSGQGISANPSITLDDAGNLHIAWVERDTANGPTQLRYTFGRIRQE